MRIRFEIGGVSLEAELLETPTAKAIAVRACTSWAAASMSRSRLNCNVILALPNELIEVICDRPLIWPNCRSMGAVT